MEAIDAKQHSSSFTPGRKEWSANVIDHIGKSGRLHRRSDCWALGDVSLGTKRVGAVSVRAKRARLTKPVDQNDEYADRYEYIMIGSATLRTANSSNIAEKIPTTISGNASHQPERSISWSRRTATARPGRNVTRCQTLSSGP